MRRFSRLVQELGATRSTRRKTTLLAEYLGSSPEVDAGSVRDCANTTGTNRSVGGEA